MDFIIKNWYFIIIPAVVIISLVIAVVSMKNNNKNRDKFFSENPNAAKVYVDAKSSGIHSNSIQIHSVNNEKPNYFIEKTKYVLGLLPGTYVISSTFTTTRPGVLHKSVTNTYGPSNQEITVEANKEYVYSFNRQEERYEFEEKVV